MNRERRSKHAHKRAPTPSPEPELPEPDRYDSGSSDRSSGEYTDSAQEFEESHFPIPTRRMLVHFQRLQQRKYEDTRRVNLDTLRAMGVFDMFLYLTGRVGFSPAFWGVHEDAYVHLTIEFLASLELKTDNQEQPYIKFRMYHQTHHVWIATVREWFGFHIEPQTDVFSFREDISKEHFYNLLTGMSGMHNRDYKGLSIPHPVLRYTQRALTCSIFARGETFDRANGDDLMMLDQILRPDGEVQRLDLMMIMIRHWIGIQQSKKVAGIITYGGYITHIAYRLGLQVTRDRRCSGPDALDANAFRLGHFIRIERDRAGHRD